MPIFNIRKSRIVDRIPTVNQISDDEWVYNSADARIYGIVTDNDGERQVVCLNDGSVIVTPTTTIWNNRVYGSAYWSGTGLVFETTSSEYYIQGEIYNSEATEVTLDAADPDLPRIDVIATNTDGEVIVITGTPGADPVKPTVDPLTQLELTYVFVGAGETTPTGISIFQVYDENAVGEWVASALVTPAGSTINFANTTSPSKGTKCASIYRNGSTSLNYTIAFTGNTPIDVSEATLVMSLKNTLRWTGVGRLIITAYNGTTQIGTISLYNGVWGYNYNLFASWQTVSIPMSAMGLTQNLCSRLTLAWSRTTPTGSFTQYFDDIQIQGGIGAIISTPTHGRLHSMVSELDHSPGTAADFGKYFRYNPTTGKVEAVAFPTIPDYGYWTLKLDSLFTKTWGLYYNWYAATSQYNIANTGWRLTDVHYNDIVALYLAAGGDWTLSEGDPALDNLREAGTDYWTVGGGTDTIKFAARGSGFDPVNLKTAFALWSRNSDGETPDYGHLSYIDNYSRAVSIENMASRGDFASVRLVKETTSLNPGDEGVYVGNDGKSYKTVCFSVTIDDVEYKREMLAENLRETKYRNGAFIPFSDNYAEVVYLTTDVVLSGGIDRVNINTHDMVEFLDSDTVLWELEGKTVKANSVGSIAGDTQHTQTYTLTADPDGTSPTTVSGAGFTPAITSQPKHVTVWDSDGYQIQGLGIQRVVNGANWDLIISTTDLFTDAVIEVIT